MSFADLLAQFRGARGLSQEQLAEACGVSVRAIGDLGRGATRRPERATLRGVARAAADRVPAPAFVDAPLVDAGRMADAVRAALAGRPRLVLLDGFEHGEAGAAELATLLARHANLRLLVTAREPVRLRAEHR